MSTSPKPSETSCPKYNKDLLRVMESYQTKHSTITYPLFKAITIAFLKENNEEVKTITENLETRDELFDFCQYVVDSKNPNIQQIVNHMV